MLPTETTSKLPNLLNSGSAVIPRTGFAVKLPSDTWQLLDIYFSYVHCWLPIIEKHDLLKVSYTYAGSGANVQVLEAGQTGDHAALWAALAFADHLRFISTSCVIGDESSDNRAKVLYAYVK